MLKILRVTCEAPVSPRIHSCVGISIFIAAMSESTETLVNVKLLLGYPPSALCFSTSV